jgi:LuxR family maltose regulon positive regulatory protein
MAGKQKTRNTNEKNTSVEAHYFSDRLTRKLDQFHAFPAAIIEAPSGYGKTTAVRDYLKALTSRNADVYWFTAVDEAPDASFRRLCREIGKIDARAGYRLLQTGFPNAFTLGEACEALRSLACERETRLVIDNFQCLCPGLPSAFLTALLEHGGAKLRIVIVTQPLGRDMRAAITGRAFLHVTSDDLRLTADDIRLYYALAGVTVTVREAETVLRNTDGWIIAVYLHLSAFRETGVFPAAVQPLLEQLVWNRLSGEQQDFFLRLSPFETATPRRMCALLGCDVLPEYELEALSGPFIRHDPATQRYEPHAVLLELVVRKRAERGAAFERECLLAAGDLCRDEGGTAEALGFYARVQAYDRILDLDLAPLIFEEVEGRPFSAIALEISERCPAENRRAHPLSMLRIAWALKAAGLDAAFEAILEELDGLPGAGDPLRAEWLLLSAYRHYPRLNAMLPLVQKAASLFGGACSRVILPEAPWAFGGYFQLTEFHLKVGEAEREAVCFEEFVALYSRLTNGHGRGADALFRAELAHLQGDLAGAEILAHKAFFLAESKSQSIVQLGAAMMLANTALIKADKAGWQTAVSLMERAASRTGRNTAFVRAVLDTVRGSLLVELGAQARIADWLKNRDIPKHMPVPAVLNALYVHVVFLLYQGEIAQFLGMLEAQPPEVTDRSAYATFSVSFLLAAGHVLAGERDKAAGFLRRAAETGLPDGFIVHFAAYSPLFSGLIEELFETRHPQRLKAFRAIKAQFETGWKALHNAVSKNELPEGLTAREREVALLAAQGLRNSEIARRLFVTESTVRTHLRAIFQKLDIDRRANLAERLK